MPSEFLCALNHHTMRKPVRSPGGHAFEAESIEAWLREHGHVCPISGARLAPEELVVDHELRHAIMDFNIKQTLAAQAKLDQEAEADPYRFD